MRDYDETDALSIESYSQILLVTKDFLMIGQKMF